MNSLLLGWAIVVALCFLARYPFQKNNVQVSIFSFFLGLLLLGLGIISIGAFYTILYIASGEWAQVITNVLIFMLGIACIWASARPIAQMVQSWFKR